MTDPITIYECPECGKQRRHDSDWCHYLRKGDGMVAVPLVAVRVFREEDVRRVVMFARRMRAAGAAAEAPTVDAALAAFPEEWSL
jgi:hypothetical protein